MNNDISFLHEIWDGMKVFVPKKERLAAAEAVVRSFDDYADMGSIEDHLDEFDNIMKAAICSYFDISSEDEEQEW